jgi:hypothetical protein
MPDSRDPGQVFAHHPWLYRLAVTASAGTATIAVVRAVRSTGIRRVLFATLAAAEAAITIGIIDATRRTADGCRGGLIRPLD